MYVPCSRQSFIYSVCGISFVCCRAWRVALFVFVILTLTCSNVQCIGDQQAATLGQLCTQPGAAKATYVPHTLYESHYGVVFALNLLFVSPPCTRLTSIVQPCSYGTGCFVLMNTGTVPVQSRNGLLTTVCYQLGQQPAVYALEVRSVSCCTCFDANLIVLYVWQGSVAVAGEGVRWLRDQMGLIQPSAVVSTYLRRSVMVSRRRMHSFARLLSCCMSICRVVGQLAAQVPDAGGVFFVPAFTGLLAPHWRPDARGHVCRPYPCHCFVLAFVDHCVLCAVYSVICGLSNSSSKHHIARALLDGVCYQTREVRNFSFISLLFLLCCLFLFVCFDGLRCLMPCLPTAACL